ncbi:Uncharacterized protein YraP [Candidatus Erwinia haradaeae]|uniref:Uncharacterized protein YraP n=1 Tax=Candidatus Erwinia haradaeae TaxID=1922217 RepID=A0A451DKE6_9GAMM|nr:division/outer membrane stress-associated lipid-binding lipoprotein [Candidatus Erwinia haradaeae]VFP87182.1 Uncharacterized protein YraP [Candidatus Erwinia haradaeae]
MQILSRCVLIVIIAMIPGCMAGIIVSAAVATKAITDPRTFGTQIDDATLEFRVMHDLHQDKQIQRFSHIIATVYQGRVLLTGQAPDITLSQRAQNIAISIHGIHEVYNEIRLTHQVDSHTMSSDMWITTKVLSQLLYNNQVKSSHIKVHTENSEVFLLGTVTHTEAITAVEIARRVHGVNHVTTAFSVIE